MMDHRRRRIIASRSSTFGGSPSVTIALPGSDIFPADEFHARRAKVGGTLARCWFAVTVGGTTYVRSFSHGPTAVLTSRADPTVHVPALSGASHRYVALGTSARTPAQVVGDCITSLALDGITATDGGADAQGRRLLVVEGATSATLPASVALDRRERGMWGMQRDDWGTGAVTPNADGGTTGTGSIHLGNPSSQSGMGSRAGRVIGVYMWGHTSHAPRLGAFTGPVYSTTPTALTTLGQNVVAALSGFGAVAFDAAAFSSSANLWATYRENAAGGPRYRLHAQTPVGRGDQAVNQRLVWDTTASTDAATAFGATYTPTNNADFGIYVSIGVIFELQDSNGNYPADGSIDEWIGDQNTDAAHGTQFAADETFLTGETTHHRFIWPAWTNYYATQFRRVYTVAAADVTSRIAMHGPWSSLAFPASPAPALLADLGTMGVLTAGAYTTMTFASPIAMETAASGGQHLSVGANYVRTGGAALASMTLPVFLDATTGDNSWLDAWEDNRTTWHDDIIGASGARALASGVSEYRTQSNVGMPNTDPTQTYPDPMAVDGGDDSPNAIALEATRITRVGMALVA